MKLYYIFDDERKRLFFEPDKVKNATLGDCLDVDYSMDVLDIHLTDEYNEDGEELLACPSSFEGTKTLKELRNVETDWHCVSYWNGSNWKKDIFESYSEGEYEIKSLSDPKPAFNFYYELTDLKDGEKIHCTCSNMSGSLSPYFKED